MSSVNGYAFYQNRLFFIADGSTERPLRVEHVDWAMEWAPTPEEKYRLASVPKPSWKLSPLERAQQGRAARAKR